MINNYYNNNNITYLYTLLYINNTISLFNVQLSSNLPLKKKYQNDIFFDNNNNFSKDFLPLSLIKFNNLNEFKNNYNFTLDVFYIKLLNINNINNEDINDYKIFINKINNTNDIQSLMFIKLNYLIKIIENKQLIKLNYINNKYIELFSNLTLIAIIITSCNYYLLLKK